MKGTALYKLVKSLSNEEIRLFHGILSAEKDSDLLLALVIALGEMQSYNEADLLARLQISKAKKNEMLRAIDGPANRALASDDPEDRLAFALSSARKMVHRVENEPAIHIIAWAVKESLRIERFDVTLALIDLADRLTEPYDFDAPSKSELVRLQQNILSFRLLEERLREYHQHRTGEADGKSILDEVENDPLMTAESNALSKRALAHYLKIRAGLFHFRRNHNASINPQMRLVQLINETEWLRTDDGFFLITEMGWLMGKLAALNEFDLANRFVFRVGNVDCNDVRSEKEKVAQLYPFRIGLAIDSGNLEGGYHAVEEVDRIIGAGNVANIFSTTNLYYSAYFYIAADDFENAFRAITRMKKFSHSRRSKKQSGNFHSHIYPMMKLLEIIIAFENNEGDDALRLIRNFRMTNTYDGNRYYKIALGTIHRLLNSNRSEWEPILNKAFEDSLQIDRKGWPGRLINYFDLPIWIAAKKSLRPMIVEFHHRATEIQKRLGDG